MPERNSVEILQKALHWMIIHSDGLLHSDRDLDLAELELDIAAMKALLLQIPEENNGLLVNAPIHIILNLVSSRLGDLIENGSLSSCNELDLEDVNEAEMLIQIIKGVAVKATSIVIKLHNEESQDEPTS